MSLITPLALFFGLLAVPIVLLYLLRLHRREQPVSSTLLWRQAMMDREANTLWQRLRRNLLLILQLLTLAMLVFALSRPFTYVPSTAIGRQVVLLDGSASMRATDVLPSRFEAAKAQVRKLIGELSPNNDMTIILVDGSPHALTSATNNQSDLNAALDAAQPSLSSANWSAGIALAAAAGNGSQAGSGATIIVVSDGSHADDLHLITGNARYIPIGTSGDNDAISDFSVRLTNRGLAALVRVTNTGPSDDKVLVSLHTGNVLLDARTLDVPARQSTTWTINGLDPKIKSLRASIDQAQHNYLSADDVAYIVNTSDTQRRALLLTKGNRFLEQSLAELPNLQLTRATTPPVDSSAQPYDLYVLDGLSMTLPVRANVLFIGAQSFFTSSGVFSDTQFVTSEASPVLQGVDWRNVHALTSERIHAPSWLVPIVQAQGGPMLFAGQMPANSRDNQPFGRVVLLPFDLLRSDLPLQVAFPVLIANAVLWLAPPQGLNVPANVKPGEVVPLPSGTIVRLPSGQRVAADLRGFAQTNELGIYTAETKGVTAMFAVNFANPSESDITPQPHLQVGGETPVISRNPQFSQHEIWPWVAFAALVLLVIEWWIYQRGLPVFHRQK